jgi:cytochrome c biogenesis protein CcdA
MTLLVLAFLGGILTVFSTCIPPVLPFVFSTANQSFRRFGDHRLDQFIRQKGAIEDHTFEIELLDAGAQAFGFTFG